MRYSRGSRPFLALLLSSIALSGCEDDPFRIEWVALATEGRLYATSFGSPALDSGYNVVDRRSVRIETAGATGSWDFAFDVRGGRPVLLPPGALGVESDARIIAVPASTFDNIREAPGRIEEYSEREPVDAVPGRLYVVRSSEGVGYFGIRCLYYAKLVVDAVDVERGRLEFRVDTNPVCNSRNLRPDKS